MNYLSKYSFALLISVYSLESFSSELVGLEPVSKKAKALSLSDKIRAKLLANKRFEIVVAQKNSESFNLSGATYLHKIVAKGRVDKVKIAFEEAKKIKDFSFHPVIGDKDRDGFTALHVAAATNDSEIIKILLESKNQDFIFPATESKTTALHSACIRGNIQAAKLLLDSNIEELRKADAKGSTALHAAATNGYDSILSLTHI